MTSRSAEVAETREEPPHGGSSLVWLAYVASAGLLGVGWYHPTLAAGSWLGIGALAWALTRTESRWRRGLGAFGAITAAYCVGYPWTPWMFEIVLADPGVTPWGYALAMTLLFALPIVIVVGVLATLMPAGRWAGWWLPPAWAVGEALRVEVTRIGIGDWLSSQWQIEPVLRAIGHLGWWPALLLCLLGAATAGEALARRKAIVGLPAAAALVCLLALPPLAPGDPAVLEGVAVVHTASTLALPRAAPATDLDLVVWPEAIFDFVPTLGEGPTRRPILSPVLPQSGAEHLVGLVTQAPGAGRQNQVVRVDARGTILDSRAKQGLALATEERFLGLGADQFRKGLASPYLEVGERRLVPAICSEALDRRLVGEGCALGATLLAIPARDGMMPTDAARRQMLSMQVMRSVEMGVPSVRASYSGWSSIVAADGAVLAVSTDPRNHFLSWSEEGGVRRVDFFGRAFGDGEAAPEPPEPTIAVLYTTKAPALRSRCFEGACSYHPLEGFACPPGARAATVIVTGHADPPTYLSHPVEHVAAAVRCFGPELVVVDACYGASTPIVDALIDLDAVFVGATEIIPLGGLHYGPAFFGDAPASERAAAVTLEGARRLTRFRLDATTLDALHTKVAAMDASALHLHLARRKPSQIRVGLEGGGALLVPVDWARFK